jgi:hypothetical protein
MEAFGRNYVSVMETLLRHPDWNVQSIVLE